MRKIGIVIFIFICILTAAIIQASWKTSHPTAVTRNVRKNLLILFFYTFLLNAKVTETVSPNYSSSFNFGMNPTRFILLNLVNQLDQHHILAQCCISRINANAFLGIFLYGLLFYVCLDNSSFFLCLSPTPRQMLVNSLLLFIVYFYLTQTLYYYFLYFSPVMLSHDILGFLALGSYSLYLSSLPHSCF